MKKFLFTLLAAIVLLPSCDKEDKIEKNSRDNPRSAVIYISNFKHPIYRSTEIYKSVRDNLGQPYDSIPTTTGNQWIEMKLTTKNGQEQVSVIAPYKDIRGNWSHVEAASVKLGTLHIDKQRNEVEHFDWYDAENNLYYNITVLVEYVENTSIIEGRFYDSQMIPITQKNFIEMMDEVPVGASFYNSVDKWGVQSSAGISELMDKYSKLYFITE